MFGMATYKYVSINPDLGAFGGTLRRFELTKKKGEDRKERQHRKFRKCCAAAVKKYIESCWVTATNLNNKEGSLIQELIHEF